jgi:hypothetical protein
MQNTFFGIQIEKLTTEDINEIAHIARMRGHEIRSCEDLIKLEPKEQENIYAIWVN